MLADELLDRDGGQVDGTVGIVDLAVPVVVREARQRTTGRVVTGIGRGGHVPLVAQRVGAPLDRLLAGVTAAAPHDEPPVPVGRQAGAEADVRPDHGVDPAVLRVGAGVHLLGVHDADIEVGARQKVGARVWPGRRRRRLPLLASAAQRRKNECQAESRAHDGPVIVSRSDVSRGRRRSRRAHPATRRVCSLRRSTGRLPVGLR